jgi:ATP-dependent DNA helicase RecG
MKASQDGFYLAERDLQIRGPGDMAGVKQSGLPEFKLADLVRDREIMQAARRRALELVESDPELGSGDNLPLKLYLRDMDRVKENYFHIC